VVALRRWSVESQGGIRLVVAWAWRRRRPARRAQPLMPVAALGVKRGVHVTRALQEEVRPPGVRRGIAVRG